ncbi:YwdI family protein [Oceanobacillus longus]|uniref:YwdI family protein n=1 Tax=Oceanobacillus longus TaxID=930120 RepID=A0ABV8GYE0_9BACI
MAITNGTILKKMMDELYQAKESQHSHAKMVAHIANVRLLSDLFLEGDQDAEQETELTKEEMKAMIGEHSGSNHVQHQQGTKSMVNHEEANGKSIFDF